MNEVKRILFLFNSFCNGKCCSSSSSSSSSSSLSSWSSSSSSSLSSWSSSCGKEKEVEITIVLLGIKSLNFFFQKKCEIISKLIDDDIDFISILFPLLFH
jgi:hypothetical protein